MVLGVLHVPCPFRLPKRSSTRLLMVTTSDGLNTVAVFVSTLPQGVVFPTFATIVMMVFTYNIANGLTAGLALYPLIKVAAGRGRELRAGTLVLALLCAVYYVFGLPH